MKVSLQSPEVIVNPDDPFQNDMLDRKKSVEILTCLVANLRGACTLAVDAEWGHGKTTFLKIWTAHLRQQGFPAVEFNAWETDYSGNPFITLSTELTKGFQESADRSLSMKIQNLRKQASRIARRAAPTVAQGVATVIPVVGTSLGQVAASLLKDNLSAYEENQRSVKTFTRVLENMAETLSESAGGRPLIVMIDELDRCRPSYAVQLLEVAKHLFSVDHIIFVLAINRLELAHSVKALYGTAFDAEGYLRRFFDADFRLPHPDRDKFIDYLLESTGINDYLDETEEQPRVAQLLKAFFQTPDLSLRRIAQATHRLALVLASLPRDGLSFARAAVVALIIRTIDVGIYYDFFIREAVSDSDVSKKIFSHQGSGANKLKLSREGRWFDVSLIKAFEERQLRNRTQIKSPLLQSYENAASGHDTFLRMLDHEHMKYELYQQFKEAVDRLEFLSDDLVADDL